MPLPNTKQQLADWILRKLGAPVINVEVADIQLEDCIDEAVQFYQEYHFDGSQRSYRTIQITDEILSGNNRRNRQLTAPIYEPEKSDLYRIGDRVTTYDVNLQPTLIWIKVDSEETWWTRTYTIDTNGTYFRYFTANDSESTFVYESDLISQRYDSERLTYVTYDSDKHNVFAYSRFVETRDAYFEPQRLNFINADSDFLLNGIVWSSAQPQIYVKDGSTFRAYNTSLDSEGGYDSEFYFQNLWLDVDGVLVEYDSDTHRIYDYTVNNNGLWVDSEFTHTTSPTADSETNKVLYDSDRHTLLTYESDSLGVYVDSEGSKTHYDSENKRHLQIQRWKLVSVPPIRYNRHFKKPVSQFVTPTYDSETNRFQFVPTNDSEISYVVSGMRWFKGAVIIGNTVAPNIQLYFYRDSDGQYYERGKVPMTSFDSEVYYKRFLPSLFLDINGVIVNLDSDVHVIPQYNILNFDSDPHTFGVGLWVDSENLNVIPTRYDSDVNKVPYDSDKHCTVNWDVVANPFDSDIILTHLNVTKLSLDSEVVGNFIGVFNRDSDNADSDINVEIQRRILFNSDIDSDVESVIKSGLVLRYVDSDGVKVLYDSEKHIRVFYDSDNLNGNYVFNVSINNVDGQSGAFVRYDSDEDSDGLIRWNGIYRFNRRNEYPTFYRKRTTYPVIYYRHNKLPEDTLMKRNKVLLGNRYTFTDTRFNNELTFEQQYKKEGDVLTEPVLNVDYSKEGQIGLPVPDDVIAVTKVFRIGQQSSVDMYNYEYQMFLNNFDFFYGPGAGGGLSNYYTLKMNLEHIDFMLNTQPAIRFNKHKDRLYIDMDWGRRLKSGDFLVAEVYEVSDPEIWGKVYGDTWLKRYAAALVKMQWGSNLRKYANVELPGGIVLNGQELYDEGKEEADKLEEELKTNMMLETDGILIG